MGTPFGSKEGKKLGTHKANPSPRAPQHQHSSNFDLTTPSRPIVKKTQSNTPTKELDEGTGKNLNSNSKVEEALAMVENLVDLSPKLG